MDTWVIILQGNRACGTQCERLAREFVSPPRTVTVGATAVLRRTGGVQVGRPDDRGTTPDLLLGLLHVLARDLTASVVVLRSDLGLPPDIGVEQAVNAALLACEEGSAQAMLIGAEATRSSIGGRHITPVQWGEEPWPRVLNVTDSRDGRPVGKPAEGVLVDTSVIVGEAWTLASLIHNRVPTWFRALRRAVWAPEDIAPAFAALDRSDFLEDVLLPSVDDLHVVPALQGWNAPRVRPNLWQAPASMGAMD